MLKMRQKKTKQKQKVTLSIDSSIYTKYKNYCAENAIMLSKKIELFMKNELENENAK
jgi:hypothetical protein